MRLFIFSFLSVMLLPIFAQNDSIEKLLLTDTEDSNKVIHLNLLSRGALAEEDLVKATRYADQSVALATHLSYPKGLSNAYNILGIIFYTRGDYEKARQHYAKALDIRRTNGLKQETAMSYNNLGLLFWHWGNYPKAIENHREALKIYQELGAQKYMADSYINMGSALISQADYNSALENYFASLRISEEKGGDGQDLYHMAAAYDGIGKILTIQSKFQQALVYYKKVLEAVQALGNKAKIVVAYNNLGSTYLDLGKKDSSLLYHDKALRFAEQNGDSIGVAASLGDMSGIYRKEKNYDKAMQLMQRSYNILINAHNNIWLAELLTDIGATFTEKKQYAAAIINLQDALDLLKGTNNKNLFREVNYNLSLAYDGLKDYEKAYRYFKQYTLYKDSVFNTDMLKQTADLQARYETEKKEKEIAEQKENLGRHKFQLMAIIIIASFIIIVIILISFLIYNRNRNKQRAELSNMQLAEQKMRTKAVIEAQEEDRKRIAKDLHDSVGQLLFILKMNLARIDGASDAIARQSEKVLDEANVELRNIALKMMPRTLNETGLAGAMHDLLDKILKNSGIEYTFEANGAEKRFEETTEIGVFRIFQEIISNILKHAQASEVHVQMHVTGGRLIIITEDNGKSFHFDVQSAKANVNKDGSGMGLLNIAIRAESLGGTILYETAAVKGTITTIRIPVTPKN